jgi:hypothetical protein
MVKKRILINIFTVKVFGCQVIRLIFGGKSKGKLICSSSNPIIVDKYEVFYYKYFFQLL